MQTTAAVLDTVGADRPYARSQPLRIAQLQVDDPRPGELLVRIAAAGVCHSDLSVVDGSRPRPVPMALGHEAAGVVEGVGPGVLDVSPGDHVVLTFVPSCGLCKDCAAGVPALCAPAAAANVEGALLAGGRRLREGEGVVNHHLGVSGFAGRAVVARNSAVVIPEDVPLKTAALFGCAMLTGTGAVLSAAAVRPGEGVAVVGLGGVGLAAVMGAVIAGGTPLVAIDPVAAKRSLAEELGATLAVAPSDLDGVALGELRYVIETSGTPAGLATAYRLTARGGVTVCVGLPDPAQAMEVPAAGLVAEGRTLVGSYLGSSAPQRDIPRLLRLWRAGRLPVERLVSATRPLGEVNEAMDDLADGVAIRQILEPSA